MARYSRSGSGGSVILLIILIVTVWTHYRYMLYAAYGLAAIGVLFLSIRLCMVMRLSYRPVAPTDINLMDGLEFERYVADLLKQHGFRNVSLTERYDMGVDIVAEKDGQRWGIQVKRYNGLVKAAAVRQVVTALKFYGCERSMVVTNSTYSNVARQLAYSNGCILIDGFSLGDIGKSLLTPPRRF